MRSVALQKEAAYLYAMEIRVTHCKSPAIIILEAYETASGIYH